MAKGGLSKRTTYNTGGGHRTTITQNTKNGTTHSYSDGGDHSRTTISHKPDGRIVRTITERHGGGYTSRTTKNNIWKEGTPKIVQPPPSSDQGKFV